MKICLRMLSDSQTFYAYEKFNGKGIFNDKNVEKINFFYGFDKSV